MKKIDTRNSLIFSRNVKDLKNSLEYINQEGYFSNSMDFSEYEEGKLDGVHASNFIHRPYEFKRNGDHQVFIYFIPKSKAVFVEEETKKYRPYRVLTELPFTIGNIIRYREKQSCNEYKGMVIEIEYQKDCPYEVNNIILGGVNVTPQELFDNYELLDKDCQYKPFGIEE